VQLFFFAQSALVAQLVLHAPATASQAYGVQSATEPVMHLPAEQVEAGCSRLAPSHITAPQTVPSVIGEHVPWCPGTAHELQAVQTSRPQQKPSVQWPLMHSTAAVQALPFGFMFVQE
jgi:hypothetical protein